MKVTDLPALANVRARRCLNSRGEEVLRLYQLQSRGGPSYGCYQRHYWMFIGDLQGAGVYGLDLILNGGRPQPSR
jgi:hypothetical protein